MKKILIFIICLIPWYLSSFIKVDYNYYNSLSLPFFTPPPIFFPIIWTITYISIAISIYLIVTEINIKDIPKSYKLTLLINYLANQSFQVTFFLLKNLFLGFISSLIAFISVLFLYQETSYLKEKSTKFLDLYVLLSLFATILSLTIYVLNTR